MATIFTTRKPWVGPGHTGNGAGGGANGRGGGDEGGRFRRPGSSATYRLGMCFGLIGVTMLFAGLTSAYIVREGLGMDWQPVRMPRILIVNAAILLFSSFTIEKARRKWGSPQDSMWLAATLVLGFIFLGGQLVAWRQLAAMGLYLGTNPHGSFFYTLTGLHGLHVFGGLMALSYSLLLMSTRSYAVAGAGMTRHPSAQRWVEVTAIYWHFMDGLWIYLVILLSS